MDNQVAISWGENVSVNFVTFPFCKLLFCHDRLESVAGIDAF